jgi:hypothetical protein
MFLETFPDLVRRKERRVIAEVLRNAFLPQIGRLHDVRV